MEHISGAQITPLGVGIARAGSDKPPVIIKPKKPLILHGFKALTALPKVRCVWSFLYRSSQKDWHFQFKLSKNGP
jgi:hypothetical protein